MAGLTRLSVLVGANDAGLRRETVELLGELGVRHVAQVDALPPLLRALETQAFDVLLCAEQLGGEDGVAVLQAARKAAPATRAVLLREKGRAGELVLEDLEAIELPLSRMVLQGLLHRIGSAHDGFWCEVSEFSLSDILQMYHQARRSITVLLSGPIAGRIRMEAGEIVDADADDEHGMDALSHLLEADSGLVRTVPPQVGGPQTIFAAFPSVILAATHRLDERRRDSMSGQPPRPSSYPVSSHPVSPYPGSAYPGGNADPSSANLRGSYPVAPSFGDPELLEHERTSVSSSVLRPVMTPMLQAVAPSPASFLVPNRARRQTLIAVVSSFAGVSFVSAAALYLNGADVAPAEAAYRSDRGTAEPKPGDVTSVARALEASAPATERAATTGAADPARTAAAPASLEPPSGFELHVTSKPSGATVSEAGRILGKTPMTLRIGDQSVVDLPRDFVLRLPGYVSARISRGASDSNVDAAVTLYPTPVLLESVDAGSAPDHLEAERPGSLRPRSKDLGIRLRR